VPAVMHLMDERMWYIPRWLDRLLPGLTIEPRRGAPAPEPTVGPPRTVEEG
jgi:RND superfamily putative drug exporter